MFFSKYIKKREMEKPLLFFKVFDILIYNFNTLGKHLQ
ncbi:hypothetical protein AEQU1_01062 [Aequorivita sp. CIP111184]|nr:hypothetical protein AEQU1_01062 [Aequorivita sp. CIP111184]